MRGRLKLTVCFAVFAAWTGRSQGPPPPDQYLYGTYNIQTKGDSGAVTISDPKAPVKKQVESWEESSWQLTFYKKGTANYVKTHVLNWTHEKDDITVYPDGHKTVHRDKTESVTDRPDNPGGLMLQFRGPSSQTYRQLAMTGNDPEAYVVETITEDTYNGQGRITGTNDLTPKKENNGVPGDTLSMHLVLAWQDARWTDNYSGSITVQNSYQEYKAPNGYYWLTVKGQWNLHK